MSTKMGSRSTWAEGMVKQVVLLRVCSVLARSERCRDRPFIARSLPSLRSLLSCQFNTAVKEYPFNAHIRVTCVLVTAYGGLLAFSCAQCQLKCPRPFSSVLLAPVSVYSRRGRVDAWRNQSSFQSAAAHRGRQVVRSVLTGASAGGLLVVLIVPLFLSFLATPGLCCFLCVTSAHGRCCECMLQTPHELETLGLKANIMYP